MKKPTEVETHYKEHLAPIYSWMNGGAAAAIDRGLQQLAALGVPTMPKSGAMDLGAGFGMHAIPLAKMGWEVLAIDSSRLLLDELRQLDPGEAIRVVQDDLLCFSQYLAEPPSLILCMTDTLLHLPDEAVVEQLIATVAEELADGGLFVITCRDYSTPLLGHKRFLPVRSDERRIFTCFLEYHAEQVVVHDILHSRPPGEDTWTMHASSYSKLRLPIPRIIVLLSSHGFQTEEKRDDLAGMVGLVARKP